MVMNDSVADNPVIPSIRPKLPIKPLQKGGIPATPSGTHGLTGGVYKARERIHRAMADARLLANPTSRSRVPDSDPN